MTASVATYPLDLVQTTLTVQTTERKYTGIINVLTTVTKQEGFLQLYRGLFVSVVVILDGMQVLIFQAVAPYVALNMTLWENFKLFFTGTHMPGVAVSAICGAMSGAIASTSTTSIADSITYLLVTYPLEIMRRHMQLNSRKSGEELVYRGYADMAQKIWRRHGIRGFYKGLIPHYLTVQYCCCQLC